MRSFTSFLVPALSFVSLVAASPLPSTTYPTHLTKNAISSRQYRYPRALVDVCADVDLSVIVDDLLGLDLGLLGDICLCLSAFPLKVDLDADVSLLSNLLGGIDASVEALLHTAVEDNGTQCTYPEHSSPVCTSGNPCAFTCADGFVQDGDECVCPQPNTMCNGKCGSHERGCSSAVPRAPLARRSVMPPRKRATSSGSSGLTNGLLAGLLNGGSNVNDVVGGLLKSNGISPISGGSKSIDLGVDLNICIGVDIGTEGLLGTVVDVVNSLLSSLLGTTIESNVASSCSASADPETISIDLQICGGSGDLLESTLDKALGVVANSLLDGAKVVTKCNVGGSGCPATLSPSSAAHSGINIDLGGVLALVEGLLGDLGLTSNNYNLNTDGGLIVDVSVELGSTLGGVDGVLAAVVDLVDEILGLVLNVEVTTRPNSNQPSSPTPTNSDIVLGINLGTILNIDAEVDLSGLVDTVLEAVSAVLQDLGLGINLDLELGAVINVLGGPGCGCDKSRKVSVKN